MLVFVPLAIVAEFFIKNNVLIFAFSALALIPLAGILGEATEELAIHTGPKIGGLLNATLGNAAELIITIVALSKGNIELVKASITGSIIGNLLLIVGFSLLLGGLRHGKQTFDRGLTGMSASMMTLAVIGLIIPTLFEIFKEIVWPQIVPVAVTGMFDVMRKGSLLIRPGHTVTVYCEEPIETAGKTSADVPELMAATRSAIAARVDAYFRETGRL